MQASLLIHLAADLLNVRLQTLGVAEHSFDVELCGSRYNWLMYDVGGAVSVYFITFLRGLMCPVLSVVRQVTVVLGC